MFHEHHRGRLITGYSDRVMVNVRSAEGTVSSKAVILAEYASDSTVNVQFRVGLVSE